MMDGDGNMSLMSLRLTDIARMLEPAFTSNSVKKAAVFGSFARGEQNIDSDIDLVVEFSGNASLLELGGLFEDVREIIGKDVDIITYRSLESKSGVFSANVMRDARVIYEAD
jgi:predicted nucleotidyltransferase